MLGVILDLIKLCTMQGKSEEDWRAALKFAQKDYEKSKVLHVEALPLGLVEWATIKTKKVCSHDFFV